MPQRSITVTVDGRPVDSDSLVDNPGLRRLLENPTLEAHMCRGHPAHVAAAFCKYIHHKEEQAESSSSARTVTVNGKPTPVHNLLNNPGLQSLLSHPRSEGRMCTGHPDRVSASRCTMIHLLHEDNLHQELPAATIPSMGSMLIASTITVEGRAVDMNALVMNPGLTALRDDPKAEVRLCRGHPAHVSASRCTNIHVKTKDDEDGEDHREQDGFLRDPPRRAEPAAAHPMSVHAATVPQHVAPHPSALAAPGGWSEGSARPPLTTQNDRHNGASYRDEPTTRPVRAYAPRQTHYAPREHDAWGRDESRDVRDRDRDREQRHSFHNDPSTRGRYDDRSSRDHRDPRGRDDHNGGSRPDRFTERERERYDPPSHHFGRNGGGGGGGRYDEGRSNGAPRGFNARDGVSSFDAPRRRTVPVDGEEIPVATLVENPGLDTLLRCLHSYPNTQGKMCTGHPLHVTASRCKFIHRKDDADNDDDAADANLPRTVTVDGERVEVSTLLMNVALKGLLAHPTSSGKMCTGHPLHVTASRCKFIHLKGDKDADEEEPHPRFVRVDGQKIEVSRLLDNTGLQSLLNHPQKDGRMCTGHPPSVSASRCTMIHFKHDRRSAPQWNQ